MPLALHQIRAVREVDDQRRHREQRYRPGVRRHDDRAGQAERRVGGRHDEVHREHLTDRVEAQDALGERDREADQHHGDHGARLGPEQHRDPGMGVERGAAGATSVHDHRGEGRRERELREVEDELDRRQSALDHERGRGPEQRAQRPGRRRSRTAGRTRGGGPRARRSERCAGTAGGPRSSRPRGSRPPGPTTAVGIDQGREVLNDRQIQGERGAGDREVQPPHRAHARKPAADARWGLVGGCVGGLAGRLAPAVAHRRVRPIGFVTSLMREIGFARPTLDPRAPPGGPAD